MEEIVSQQKKKERRRFSSRMTHVNRGLLYWLAKAKRWNLLKQLLRTIKALEVRKRVGAKNEHDESQLRLYYEELDRLNLRAQAEVIYDEVDPRIAA